VSPADPPRPPGPPRAPRGPGAHGTPGMAGGATDRRAGMGRPRRDHRPRPIVADGPREIAAQALARVLDDDGWAAPVLSSVLENSALPERDRALTTELFYGALRFARPLERSLLRGADKPGRGLDARMRPHLLIAAYQLQHLQERIPAHAAVDAAVTAVRRVRPGLEGFANALLRRLGSALSSMVPADAPLPELAEAWGVPLPLAAAVVEGLPVDERAAALGGLCARPTTYAAWLQGGPPAGAVAHAFVPGVAALAGGRVSDVDGYKEGDFLVLDPGSALCALAVAARPGQRIVDLCSAPGGKAMLLAHAAGPDGRVVAVERHDKRSRKVHDNARRLGLSGRIAVVVGDAAADDVLARARDALGAGGGDADAVLLDAPCSGLGTTRRKPEIKLRRTDDAIASSVELQRRLLDAAASLVRPGGVLVYSVCSPMPAEGRDQIAAFRQRRPDFVLEALPDVLPFLPADAVDARGQLRLLPHRHDADAFFVARLRRRDDAPGPR
jgi:16S rRNA (cytosine967-C5)-methyltransferase